MHSALLYLMQASAPKGFMSALQFSCTVLTDADLDCDGAISAADFISLATSGESHIL